MKNLFLLISFIFAVNSSSFSQYNVMSKYLQNPELTIGFVDSCAGFWLNSYDDDRGGFYTNVDRQGNVVTEWGTKKNMLTQSRNAYGMVRAFMLTGNELYLEKAKRALEFMYESAWDNENGGWFGEADENGNPQNITKDKTAFDQHYALLGILAYFEATGDSAALNWFYKGLNHNLNMLWDDDSGKFGYYDHGTYDWNTLTGKSFNATVDALTTHLLNGYLLTEDNLLLENMLEVADNIVNRFATTMDLYKIGFVENFNTDWTWSDNQSNNNTRTIMGHVLKAGWVLGRVHQIVPDDIYIETAEKLVTDVLDNGYDHKYGGPFKDYDRITGEMYFYGQDTAKAWWQMEQAIVSGLILYHLTNNEKYLQMADESLDFFMKYFVDHTYGEIFADLFSNGSLIPAWGTTKGNDWKAGYHSIETGYYTYLYGNLYYKDDLATIYYKFEPVDEDRSILLSPLAINEQLTIDQVYKDDNEYFDYSAEEKRLFVAAADSGLFRVSFKTDIPFSANDTETLSNEFTLSQNYPNPFNPITNIRYSIAADQNSNQLVSLKVYDVLGQETAVLVDQIQSPGNYEIEFNGSNLSSGIYFYTIRSGSWSQTKRMILLK